MAWQIIGHDWAVALLRQGLAAGRISHAYLFSGPPQIGKTRLALALAQALSCAEPDPPCGHCPSCRRILRRAHPDVRLVEGEGVGGSIKIDQIRALQREAILAAYEGRYRVFILPRVDRASAEAANSLLKTLEEPPAHVVLILTAAHAETLPSTVVSRCQRIDLRPVAQQILEPALIERGLPPAKAQLLARLSGGRVGWALAASKDDDAILQQRQQDLNQMLELLSAGRVERLDFAWKASRDQVAALRLLDSWAGWWRDLLLLHGWGEDSVANVDRLDELRLSARQSTLPEAWMTLKMLRTAGAQLEANVNPRLALEGMLLKLPHHLPLHEP